MPGRPKKERKRDQTEPKKGTKMSKVGTKIRCSKCKQVGHNKSSCERRSAASSSANSGGQQSGAHNAIAMMSNTKESCSTSRERKAPAGGQDSTSKVTSVHFISESDHCCWPIIYPMLYDRV